MKPFHTLPIIVLLLAFSPGVFSQETATDWGMKLSSRNYAEREQAARALEKLGAPALPVLNKVLAGNDLETRRRAALILERIEERLLAEDLVKATPLRLRLEKLPLKDALREIEKQTGLPCGYVTDSNRTVSVDTGTIPYWQAWQQFCRAAQLDESDSIYSAEKLGELKRKDLLSLIDAMNSVDILQVRLPRMEFAAMQPHRGFSNDDRHSIRVRVKWLTTAPAEDKADPLAIFVVELRGEPRLHFKTTNVTITRIVDDEGRAQAVKTINAQIGEAMYSSLLHVRAIPWSQPARTVKELHGQLDVQFTTRPQMMAVKNVLHAAGKEIIGKHGVVLKVVKAVRTEEGDIRLSLFLDNVESFTPKTPEEQIVRVRPGVVAIRGPVDVALTRLQLLDDRGQPYRQEKSHYQVAKESKGYDVEMVFAGNGNEREDPSLAMLGELRTISAQMPFVVRSVVPPAAAKAVEGK